jgi:hypothetical protein
MARKLIGNTGGDGGQDIYAPYNPFESFGDKADSISAWYKSRTTKAGRNYNYWERKGTTFNQNNINSLWNSRGSMWSQEDWTNQVKSIMAGEDNVQWKDGVKYQQRSKTGWGSKYWEPAKGFEVTYKTTTDSDGAIHKTAVENRGFADYGSHWSRAGRAKINYKGAQAYQRGDQKAMEEYGFRFPADAPPPEQPADAPSTSEGDARGPSTSVGTRKTTDMTISANKKRKELGAPGGGGKKGAGLGVSY